MTETTVKAPIERAASRKSRTTTDRITYCRSMAEESRRSPIGSEREANEWDDRAWRIERGMDEDDD